MRGPRSIWSVYEPHAGTRSWLCAGLERLYENRTAPARRIGCFCHPGVADSLARNILGRSMPSLLWNSVLGSIWDLLCWETGYEFILMALSNNPHPFCYGACAPLPSERFCPGLQGGNIFCFVRMFPIHRDCACYFLYGIYTARTVSICTYVILQWKE